ncbi:MAG TPA: YceD family protein [Burkholderiales bacterium]|nr:YceD family protein [Burkholderiales bacterium]
MRDRVTVDSVAFARDARELRGRLPVADLARLRDALVDTDGDVAYRLAGSMDKDGKATLQLEVAAKLQLVCQRCLGPVEFDLQSTRDLVLVPPGQPLADPADEPDDVEEIHADAKLDVAALVEDEVILSLPMVAAHEAGECAMPKSQEGMNETQSAFGSLASLKRQ